MSPTDSILCTVATPGIEVVTQQAGPSRWESVIHGGRLDGETFDCDRDPESHHEAVCRLVRMRAWPVRGIWRGRQTA